MIQKEIEHLDTAYIFSDGAAIPNPGFGCAAYALVFECYKIITASEAHPNFTNNKAEILGATLGLRQANQMGIKKAVLVSDSEYVLKGLGDWAKTWIAKGWIKKSPGGPTEIPNTSFWKDLIAEAMKFDHLELQWTRGHANNLYQNIADEISQNLRTTQTKMKLHPFQLHYPAKTLHTFNKADYDGTYKKPKKQKKKIPCADSIAFC